MTSIKKEIMEEFKKKFVMKSMYGNHINFHADPVLDFLSQALTRIEEEAREEAIDAISDEEGWEESREYYKNKLLPPSEEKECKCIARDNPYQRERIILSFNSDCPIHCSPKKEKRGR